MQEIPGVTVVALADPNLDAAIRLAATIARRPTVVTGDYRELLRCGLDAVCIASPDLFHVPQILDALAAGMNVLCEKPLTPSITDLERVLKARDTSGRIVALTYQRRYDGAHRAMRREILSGRWGRVTAVSVYNAEDWITPNRGTWRHDPAICPGGFFYDASGHQLDMVFWATGLRGSRVQAWTDTAGTRVPIRIWGHAILTGRVPMTFHFVGDAHAWREQVNIHCEGRDFCVENFHPRWCIDGKPAPIEPEEPGSTADAHFVQMIREGSENWAPPEDARPVIQFTAAALRAAEIGAEVEVAA